MQPPPDDVTHFHSVDAARDPAFFARFMDASHARQSTQSYQQRMMEHLAVQPGATLLDVGCGLGQDVLALAHAVGPQGHVIGIDTSVTMIREAQARAANTQLPVEYRVADATQLPFADASFDGCQATRIFGYLAEPTAALAEMARVARPGARIALAEGDSDMLVIDIADRALARKIVHLICDSMAQGWIGRQLPRLLRQAGLEDISVEGRIMPLDYPLFQLAFGGLLRHLVATGALAADEHVRFDEALLAAERAQDFFAGAGGFIISGRKPV